MSKSKKFPFKTRKSLGNIGVDLDTHENQGEIAVVGAAGSGKSFWITAVREHTSDTNYMKKFRSSPPVELQLIENRKGNKYHLFEVDGDLPSISPKPLTFDLFKDSQNEPYKLEQLNNANVCVICFSLVDSRSLSAATEWLELIQGKMKNKIKTVLLGTRMDLRNDLERKIKHKRTDKSENPAPYPNTLEIASTDKFFTIQVLPSEVLEQVFMYLGVVQRARIATVCKSWHYILCEKSFGNTIYGAPTSTSGGKKLAESSGSKYCECSAQTGKGVLKAAKLCLSESRKS